MTQYKVLGVATGKDKGKWAVFADKTKKSTHDHKVDATAAKNALAKKENMNEAVEMCPTACCGEPVTECKCSADCEHCDCHAKNKARMNESKKTIREGVLDDMDDDGFMAKRQLYDLAKYAVELHRQIQDTDDLEPWVSAKITKAQDYISTVKHYMEYNAMRGAEDTADQMGAMDMADMDAVEVQVGDVGDVEYATTEDLMADADPYVEEAQTLNGMDVLRMALGRGIISQNQFNDPEEILMGMADGMADMLTHNDVKNSADISVLMKEFVSTAESQLVLLMGPKVDAYYGMTEAKRIYEKMMRGIKGKK